VRGRWIKAAILASAIAVVGAVFAAGPAGANPPTGYGFDDTSHVVVGGGSDTTYIVNQLLADDWAHSDFGNTGGCTISTAVAAGINECVANANPETNDLGNWQHDTLTNANPAGSGAGIASLNGFNGATYGGTANGGNVDFARSSRGAKGTGGNCSGGNELTCDTFWGFGQDGIQITSWQTRHNDTNNGTALANHAITPLELFHIFNCDFKNWSDVPSLGITAGAANDGPIVPWGMQTSSGTFSTFQSFIQAQPGVPAGWSPDAPTGVNNTGVGTIDSYTHKVGCARQLSNTSFPFENDMKPLINDPAAISTDHNSVDDPVNWITWSSFGVMQSFTFLSQPTRTTNPGSGVQYNTTFTGVNGVLPSFNRIQANTWAIGRTLYHVTRKADADCPLTGSACDFSGNPGPTANVTGTADLNVTGGASGVSGAVREFTRWLCRPDSSHQQSDPVYGTNYDSKITGDLSADGFTVVPGALITTGTRCHVVH
jgi:ABC-type phosphate transport system substrate-binding protein